MGEVLKTHRIAFVHSFLPAGGATVFLLNLAGGLIERGFPAEVFSSSGLHPLAPDFERRKIPVSLGRWQGRILEDRVRDVVRRLSAFAPNIVVANLDPTACEVLRHAPPGVVRVGVVHALSQWNVAALYSHTFHRLVAISEHLRSTLKEMPELKHRDIDCLEMGVPIPPDSHRETAAAHRPLRILYLGRLEEAAKRVRRFPAIWKELTATGVPFSWTICGDGPERDFLEKNMVVRRQEQQIHFAGAVPYSRLPEILAAHDVLLLTSDSETFSLSLHEAMAAGLVPVTSDLPGPVREAVTAGAGFLVPPGDIPGYARAIVRLHEDRGTLKTMSARARAAIGSQHSVEKMVDRWLAFFGEAPNAPVSWPKNAGAVRPICDTGRWKFTPVGRGLRRMAAAGSWRRKY